MSLTTQNLSSGKKQLHMGLWSIQHHNKLATIKLVTTEIQIVTSGDLTFSLCVACHVKLTLNEG